MPYQIEVQGETTIWVKMIGELTVEEIAEMNDTVVNEHLADGRMYYVVYDLSELDKFPMNARKMTEASTILQADNIHYEIIVGIKNPILDFLAKVVNSVFGRSSRLMRFGTEAEVNEFIQRSMARQ